jgi:hypothetical protein
MFYAIKIGLMMYRNIYAINDNMNGMSKEMILIFILTCFILGERHCLLFIIVSARTYTMPHILIIIKH